MSASLPVAVIIPTHNRAGLVATAIRSVLAQTRAVSEIIVVDDASTDGTQEVLAGFEARREIRTLRFSRNIERGAARNAGVEAATSEYVAFLDSDDAWAPDKIERQASLLAPSHAVLAGLAFIDGWGREVGRTYTPPPGARDRIFVHNPYLGAPSSLVMARAAFYQLGGFPEARSIQGSEDWVLLVKMAKSPLWMITIRQPLVRYRIHDQNSTGDPDNLRDSMWAALEHMEAEHLLPDEWSSAARARTAGVIARGYASQARWQEALDWAKLAATFGEPAETARALHGVLRTGAKTVITKRP